jgi:hypothetical protein
MRPDGQELPTRYANCTCTQFAYKIQRGEECRWVHQEAANWGRLKLREYEQKDTIRLRLDPL